jgi:hypothetical protein
LFFDAISGPNSVKNKKIITYLKWLNYILENYKISKDQDRIDLLELKEELEKSIKTWMKYFFDKVKTIGWEPKLKALETRLFYAKWDNLNLYSYLFFSRFPNIETVKFPTRGRNYNEKIKVIEDVIDSGEVKKEYIDRSISLERAHYDLTYLFWDKLWFRKMLKNNF